MDLEYIVIDDKYFNVRDVLRAEFKVSSRLLSRLKSFGKVFLNGKVSSLDERVFSSDVIKVNLGFDEVSSSVVPTSMELNIVYEDDYLLILDKPAGIPVHPSMRHFDNSLSNGVRFYFDQIRIA
ncbi:MAG: hypothetical protein HFJ52_06575 [Clostridia bacterium]|nr:hypothetical protein [Clostridia bacterium]